jgi:thiol-disulfide isomerase/thioredoxin
LIVALYFRVEAERSEDSQAAFFSHERLSGAVAPELTLTGTDGRVRTLGDMRGKAVLLHFWATWCEPCKKELPQLLELGRELASEGAFELVALSVDDHPEAVRTFFAGRVPAEVYRDGAGAGAKLYEVSALPDAYLIDAKGALRLRLAGARDWSGAAARSLLRQHLPRGGP